MASRSPEIDLSHLLRRYPEADEARAEDLASVLTAQDVVASSIWVNEPEDGGPAGYCVYVEPVHAGRAETVATAFEADHASALDDLTERGIRLAWPVRGGCGLFWFFPAMLTVMGTLGLARVGTQSPAMGAAMLALGLLIAAAFQWALTGDASNADDVERRA